MSSEYIQAGRAVSAVHSGKSGLKNAIFDVAGKARNVKRIYALVTETIKRRQEIQKAMNSIPPLKHADVDKGMLHVLIYELLWGAGKIKGGGVIKRLVMQHEDPLRKISGRPKEAKPFAKLKTDGDLNFSEGENSNRGRWVRVNTLIATPDDVIGMLTNPELSRTNQALRAEDIKTHPDIPYMFYLPAGSHSLLSLHDHPSVTQGCIILQDLPSALPAHALFGEILHMSDPRSSSSIHSPAVDSWREFVMDSLKGTASSSFDVIDACAAPGNKTSQLAALLHGIRKEATSTTVTVTTKKGVGKRNTKNHPTSTSSSSSGVHVFAFDRDNSRLNLLSERMVQASAGTIVTATCADFLTLDVNDPKYANVQAVLVDPSCSGSGMRAVWDTASSMSSNECEETSHVGNKRQRDKDTVSDKETNNVVVYTPPPVPDREQKRVTALADFQTNAVLQALRFPNVKRVVYSTCSLYEEENEGVVARVLSRFNEDNKDNVAPGGKNRNNAIGECKVRLVPTLPSWPLRGCVRSGLTGEQAESCLRWDPLAGIDTSVYGDLYLGETGFFVALFEKY